MMLKIKNNEQIGAYLRKQISSKYKSNREFCREYIQLDTPNLDNELVECEIIKLANRLSQILQGKKSIQIYDLPIFSEILKITIDDILSAGEIKHPINNRLTNYNIAFSKNKSDWIKYLNREDCIAAYKDEFGKTVIDYALECGNYKFIKFLIDEEYIWFVNDEKKWFGDNFGADTKIKTRPYDNKTMQDEFYENIHLRTKVLALALKSNDDSVLDSLRAREIPSQYNLNINNLNMFEVKKFYDESFVQTILNSKDKVFDYFLNEYEISSIYMNDYQFKWIFPFIDKLINKAIDSKNSRANILLDKVIEHNNWVYHSLKQEMLDCIKIIKKNYYQNRPITEVLEMIRRDFHLNGEKNCCSFCPYCYDGDYKFASNIISVDVNTIDLTISKKINNLNEIYSKIIILPNNLLKDNK